MALGIWLRISISRTDLTFELKMSQKFQLQYKTTNNSVRQGKTVERQVQCSLNQQQHETITTEGKMGNLDKELRVQVVRKNEQP